MVVSYEQCFELSSSHRSGVRMRDTAAMRFILLTSGLITIAVLMFTNYRRQGLLLVSIDSVPDNVGDRINADDYFNRRYFQIKMNIISYDSRISEENAESEMSQNSHRQLAQNIREFNKEDVVSCFDSLSVKRNRRPMHIAFVGDSTIRQHFISFILWIPDYDRIIKRNSTTAAVYKFHEDRNITTPLMDNLLVSFYWRNLIQNDLIDDFKRWASTSDDSRVPDFILLGVTAHHIVGNSITNSLETFETHFTRSFLPLINETLTRHPHQEIVWLLQSPTMEYMGPGADNKNRGVTPDKIIKYNQVIRRIFKGTRVLIWDAMGVVTEEYLRTCALTRFQRTDKSWYTNCKDFIHPGVRAISIGTQLIFNHICESPS